MNLISFVYIFGFFCLAFSKTPQEHTHKPIPSNSKVGFHKGNNTFFHRLLTSKLNSPIKLKSNDKPKYSNEEGDDVCSIIGDKDKVYTYEQVLDCFDSIPFDKKIADGVLDTLWKFIPFYVFSDVARKRSVDAVRGGKTIDLESLLAVLRVKKYTSLREFLMDTADLFTELRDGHTVFIPSCFSIYNFLLPFPLVLLEKDYKLEVKVKGGAPFTPAELKMWKNKGIDVKKFNNAKVLSIDDMDPIKAIGEIADSRYGTSRDPHSRINGALAGHKLSNGVWTFTFGAFAQSTLPPKNSTVKFVLKVGNKNHTIVAPYLARPIFEQSFNSRDEMMNQYCLEHSTDTIQKAKEVLESLEKSQEETLKNEKEAKESFGEAIRKSKHTVKKNMFSVPLDMTKRKKFKKSIPVAQLDKPLLKGKFVSFYIFNHDIGVAVIPTFDSSSNPTLFKNEILKGFKLLKKHKAKKLILDVSHNQGGVVCHGYSILRYLLPASKFKPFRLDMHMNPLLSSLMMIDKEKDSAFNPAIKLRPNNTYFHDFSEFMPKGDERADVENRYTNFFHNDCESEHFMKELKDDPESTPFELKDITLVSNSICYSTCGLFANSLQELANVVTVSVGGSYIKNYRFPTAGSMNGANVMPHEGMYAYLYQHNLTDHPLAPKPFPVKASFALTLMQAYSHFPDKEGLPIPLEFLARPADRHFYYDENTVVRPELIWLKVARERGYSLLEQRPLTILNRVSHFFKSLFGFGTGGQYHTFSL